MTPARLKQKIKALLIELKYPFFYSTILVSDFNCFDYYKVQTWLREKHNVHCNPEIIDFTSSLRVFYRYRIHYMEGKIIRIINSKNVYDDYESALNKGVYESLKIIKKNG